MIAPWKRPALMVILVVSTIVAAYILGGQVGTLLASNKAESARQKFEAKQQEVTDALISRAKGLEIGVTLPDHQFERMNGEQVNLTDLITKTTQIAFFDPECDQCLDEMILVSQKAVEPESFIFITAGNLRLVEDQIDEFDLSITVLYDHRRSYMGQFEVYSYPFNLFVDGNMTVVDILAGPITAADIQKTELANK